MKNPSDKSFTVQWRKQENQVTYYLTGILDEQGGRVLWEKTEKNLGESESFEFNLCDVRLISSAGIGVLAALADWLKTQGKSLKLTNPSAPVMRVLQLVHLDKLALIE